jgi:hypothetical protein
MGGKRGGLLLLILGALLIAVALVIKFVILPGQAQFPGDVDSTRTYDGTLNVMLNPQALASGDLANLFLRDVPITNARHVTTEEVKGGKAIVLEEARMLGPGGQEIIGSDTWYAIDRKTMKAVPDFSGNPKVTDREGLVIGFPIGTEKKAYEGWSGDYQATVTVNYVREEKHEASGLNTYVFEASSGPREIKDPELLQTFPPGLPKALFMQLAQSLELPVPEEYKQPLGMVLANLPDPVPFKYTYEYETTYWIEPTTGVLIDYKKHEARKAALAKDVLAQAAQGVQLPEEAKTKLAQFLQLLPDPVPLTPVFEQSYYTSDQSIQDSAKDAKDAKSQLDLFGTTLPLALGAAGLVLAVVGLILLLRR